MIKVVWIFVSLSTRVTRTCYDLHVDMSPMALEIIMSILIKLQ